MPTVHGSAGLADAGMQVVSAAYARDDLAAVVEAVERALDDARAVIVTGGLGRIERRRHQVGSGAPRG